MLMQSGEERRSIGTARLFTKDAILCALLLAICMLAIWPIAEIGINDDWSYVLTTQAFLRTHHFVYNGWSAPIVGWQVLWGSVFAWLIRPDFVGIRLSTIPLALLTVVVYHAVLRNFGLNRAHALFGTLTLSLTPVFVALSATFMTDIPSLLVIIVCIYLCQRALAAQNDRHAALWLAAAALTNIMGGTVRQITWLGFLVIVPSCAWLLRRRKYIIPLTMVLWLAGALFIRLVTTWFLRHPYSRPETLLEGRMDAAIVGHLFLTLWQLVATSVLFMFPVLVMGLAARWPPKKRVVLPSVAAVLLIGVIYLACKKMGYPDLPKYLWAGNIVTASGIMQGPELFASSHQVRTSLLVVLFAIEVPCAISFAGLLSPKRARVAAAGTEVRGLSWREINFLLLPFLASYIVLLCPRAAFTALFDRYLLEVMAVLLIYALRWHQERVSSGIPAIAKATLAIIAVLGVAGTHDLFAMARAEVRLTEALQKAGIPRIAIRGGFDFDTVTEVYTTGYVNDPHIVNPPGAYHPVQIDESGPCSDPFLVYLPAMVHQTKYVITSGPRPCTLPTSFPPQRYFTWLPPAHRELYVVARQLDASAAPKP